MPVLPSVGTRLGAGWGAYLQDAPMPGATDRSVGDVLGEQIRFRLVKSGATGIDDVRPDSAAAAELWKHQGVRDIISGVMQLAVEKSAGPTPLRGFTLATSEPGYVANRATHAWRQPDPTKEQLEFGLGDATRHTTKTSALRKGKWLHLGPERSAGLIEVLKRTAAGEPRGSIRLDEAGNDSLGRGVKTLLHELTHVGSPRPHGAEPFDWLREGTAETLARWPGRVEAAGKAMGIHVPEGVGAWFDREGKPYQEEVDSVRAILKMCGIDHTNPEHFAAADQLLTRTPVDQLPGELARRIAANHVRTAGFGILGVPPDPSRTAARAKEIIESQVAPDGSHADPAPLKAFAESLGMHA